MNRAIRVLAIVELAIALISLPGAAEYFGLMPAIHLAELLASLLATPYVVLAIALAVLVMIDAAARHRRDWFAALLVLSLTLTLPEGGGLRLIYTVISLLSPNLAFRAGALSVIFDLLEVVPLLIALAGLLYAFRSARWAAEPAPSSAGMRRAIRILAIVALVLLGPSAILTLLAIADVNTPIDSFLVTNQVALEWFSVVGMLQEPLVVAIGVLVMVQAYRQHRWEWLVLLILLTLLAALVAGINGILIGLELFSNGSVYNNPAFLLQEQLGNAVARATTLAAIAVPLAALIFTLLPPPKADSTPGRSSQPPVGGVLAHAPDTSQP